MPTVWRKNVLQSGKTGADTRETEGHTVKFIWTTILVCGLIIAMIFAVKVFNADLNYQASADITINVAPEQTFRLVSNLENWVRWSPFVPTNAPDVQIQPNGPKQEMTWNDPRGGVSILTLDEIDSAVGVVQHSLTSGLFPGMKGTISVEEIAPGKSKVVWTVAGSLPDSLFYRLASSNYGDVFAIQLQQSLDRLKSICEKDVNFLNQQAKQNSSPVGEATDPSTGQPAADSSQQ